MDTLKMRELEIRIEKLEGMILVKNRKVGVDTNTRKLSSDSLNHGGAEGPSIGEAYRLEQKRIEDEYRATIKNVNAPSIRHMMEAQKQAQAQTMGMIR